MSDLETKASNHIGFVLYTFFDLTTAGAAAFDVISAVAAAENRNGATRYMVVGVDGRQSRYRAFNRKNASSLLVRLLNGDVGSVLADNDLTRSESQNSYRVDLGIGAAIKGHGRPNTLFVSIGRHMLRELGGTEYLLKLAKSAFQKLKCCYGYCWTAEDDRLAKGAAYGVVVQYGSTRMTDREIERTGAWFGGQRYCRTLVRDIYWANFLGPQHLGIIGSLEALEKSGLINSYQPLEDGSQLMLVTDNPDDFLAPAGQSRAQRLREALKPIIAPNRSSPERLPGPPSFLTGAAAATAIGRIQTMVHAASIDLRKLLEVELDWSEQSLVYLDKALTKQFLRDVAESDSEKGFSPDDWKSMHMVLIGEIGSYLGEMIIRQIGGGWLPREPYWESAIRIGDTVYDPYAMAAKRLSGENGEELAPHFRWVKERENR